MRATIDGFLYIIYLQFVLWFCSQVFNRLSYIILILDQSFINFFARVPISYILNCFHLYFYVPWKIIRNNSLTILRLSTGCYLSNIFILSLLIQVISCRCDIIIHLIQSIYSLLTSAPVNSLHQNNNLLFVIYFGFIFIQPFISIIVIISCLFLSIPRAIWLTI